MSTDSPEDRSSEFLGHMMKCQRSVRNYLFSLHPRSQDIDDLIQETARTLWRESDDFLRPLGPWIAEASPAGDRYAELVGKAAPLAWWRFEKLTPSRQIPGEIGHYHLSLHGSPGIVGPTGHGFLHTDTATAAGFTTPEMGIPGLDTPEGMTLECLLHPSSELWGTAISLENPDQSPPLVGPLAGHVAHSPHRLAIERMGRRGSKIGHVHPDFALRAIARSPAGYEGGTNSYSAESHLLHRWVHMAFTNDGSHLRLYVDGQLSDETPVTQSFQNATLRPIIGRLQPKQWGEKRQWTGGIDEVALYGRALTSEEIRAHFEALE